MLKALAEIKEGAQLSNLAQDSGLNISTVHHILKALRSEGFVELDEASKRYRAGLWAFLVGNADAQNLDLRRTAVPCMERFVRRCNETTYLAVLSGATIVHLARVDCSYSVRPFYGLGEGRVGHCTALGKALLAELPPNQLGDVIAKQGLPRYTSNTITKFEDFIEELRKVRAEGYALDQEEFEKGLFRVAAPIRDHESKVVAALSIAVPKQRFDQKRIPALTEICMETAKEARIAVERSPRKLGAALR